MICNIFSVVLISVGACLLYRSNKLIFKKNYLYKSIGCLLLYSAGYILSRRYIHFDNIEETLDAFSSMSATLAGFVFAGLAIILALIEYDHIKNLFKNDFLDNLFYKGYGSIMLNLCNIVMYIIIKQYDFINQTMLLLNQYILGASILLLIMMMFDFIFVIKQLKNNLNKN